DRSGPRRPAGGASGSEVSLSQLLEHVDVEGLVGDQLLQSSVLTLEVLEAPHLLALHARVLCPPAVPGGLGDAEVAQDLRQVFALVEEPLAFADLAQGLFGCV